MRGEIIIGTVRGTRNGRPVVVLRDGKTMDVNFEGGQKPLIGSDVIGRVTYNNRRRADHVASLHAARDAA